VPAADDLVERGDAGDALHVDGDVYAHVGSFRGDPTARADRVISTQSPTSRQVLGGGNEVSRRAAMAG
jgi:hypothetical protein